MNERLEPPTHLEPDYLYQKYEPLRKAMFNKYKDRMSNESDKQDLISTVNYLFIQLTMEYDPNIGVDYPYYIKKMLDLRTGHYVTKHLTHINRESYTDEELIIEDNTFADVIEKIIELHSINPDIVLGEKHRRLMIGVMIEKKTLRELAEEEGVSPDRLHARLYFLLKKLNKEYEQTLEAFGRKQVYIADVEDSDEEGSE